MIRYLIDTNILIDALRYKRPEEHWIAALGRTATLACSVVTLAELYAGIRSNETERTEAILGGMELLPVTPAVAIRAGLLKKDWGRRGVTLALPDVLIAATAIAEDMTLVTANRRHFPMPELKLYPIPEP
ncbi:MAG: type II toxin-antitoxin system VapC family toxin [Bryobacteraceae bacterium]|nr:type II toxin-antitoxin system VapC family toxin [Bryobacteraceae bacterium]